MLVRDALLQGLGRGRGMTNQAVPVVVADPLHSATLYEVFLARTEQNAKDIYLANCSVTGGVQRALRQQDSAKAVLPGVAPSEGGTRGMAAAGGAPAFSNKAG